MIGWLDGNPAGKVLAGAAASLAVALLLLGVIWSLPPSGTDIAEGEGSEGLSAEVTQLQTPPELTQFAVITDRPVFHESRQPVIAVDEVDGEDSEGDSAEVDVDAPDVELAGVVITPEVRVAMLRPKDGEESLLAFEGVPLEGNYGSWQVSRIEPRNVILSSSRGEEVRLDLQIHDATIERPPEPEPKPEPQEVAGEEQTAEAGEAQPLSRAEEIRQRIAERREELRRAAEEGGAEEAKPADYRSAIQQMMRGRQNQASDENDQ